MNLYEVEHEGNLYEIEAESVEEVEKITSEQDWWKIDPADATAGDVAGDLGSALAQGYGIVSEGVGDIVDELNPFDRINRGVEAYKRDAPIGEVIGSAMLPKALSEWAGSPQPEDLMEGPRQESYDVLQPLTEYNIKKGVSSPLDAARTAAEWVPSLIDPKSATKRGIGSIVGGSSGAALGEWLGGETGELIVGILGSLQGGNFAKAGEGIASLFKRSGKANATKKAAQFLADNADLPPEQLVTKLEEAVKLDEAGTVGQITGDVNLLGAENVAGSTPQGARTIAQAADDRANQIVTQVGDTMPGDSAFPKVQAQINQNVQAIDQTADAASLKAQQRAEEAAQLSVNKETRAVDAEIAAMDANRAAQGNIIPSATTYEASEQLAKQLDTSEQLYKDTFMNPAWEAFDKLRGKTGLQSAAFKASLTNFMKTLPKTQRDVFQNTYGKELAYIEGLNKTARPSEIQFIISQMKKITSNAAQTGTSTAADKFLTNMSMRLENQLLKDPVAGKLYQEAVDATAQKTAQFGQRNLGKQRVSPEVETFGQRYVTQGDQGAANARDLARSGPESIAKAGEYLKSLVARDGAEAVWSNYGPFLREFPDNTIVAYIDDARRAEANLTTAGERTASVIEAEEKFRGGLPQAVETVTKEARQTSKKLKSSLSNSVMGQFVKDPIPTIEGILNKPGYAKRIDELIEYTGDAAGVRAAFKSAVVDKLFIKRGGKNVVNETALDKLNSMNPQLERLFADAPEELDRLNKAVAKAEVEAMRRTAKGVKLDDAGTVIEDFLTTGGAALIMDKFQSSHQLMFAGMMKRNIGKLWSKVGGGAPHPDPEIIDEVASLLSDPQKFLANMPPPAEGASLWSAIKQHIADSLSTASRVGYLQAMED